METCPPITAQDIKKDLVNPTFAVYLYIGKEADKGWELAQIVFGLIPRLRIFCVLDAAIVEEWVGDKRPRGIVFGWGDKPFKRLTKAETEDLEILVKAITEAMEQEQ